MTNPLSPLVYFRRNASRALPMGLVIVLAVFLIAGVTVLANAIDLTVRTIYRYTDYFTYVLPQQQFREVPEPQRVIVESDPRVERTMEGAFFLCNIKTVMGRLPFVVLGVPDDDRDYLMQRMGTTLVAGRLPAEGMPEAVLSEPMVENKKLKIGDNVVSPTEQGGMATAAPIPVKLVGILKGPVWVGFTSRSFCTRYFLLNPRCTLYTWKDNSQRDTLNRSMMPVSDKSKGKLSPTEVQVLSKENLITEVRDSLESLYMIMGVVTSAVIFAITLMSGMLANIYFTQRLSEFGVLAAIGYSRPKLIGRVLAETALLNIAGWIVGAASTALLMRFLGESVFRARGLFLDPFDLDAYAHTIPVPICITLFSVGTITYRLLKLDPVTIIERR
ncbi:ABC transporter permease [Armatimonas sp.]|uniref:ABC transporter permease n=1 Tax=Armatimonas sp. TaxID=1872638 RepID=UPI00286A3927|nr:ABC transporter permease [Armatimonas sp.]